MVTTSEDIRDEFDELNEEIKHAYQALFGENSEEVNSLINELEQKKKIRDCCCPACPICQLMRTHQGVEEMLTLLNSMEP